MVVAKSLGETVDKGEHRHFMLKEIMEQPRSIADSIRGRISASGEVKLGGLVNVKRSSRMHGALSSLHAEQVGMQVWSPNTFLKNILAFL